MTFLPTRLHAYFPIRRVKVSGNSMLPKLQDGQSLIFHEVIRAKLRVGDIVLIERENYPGIYFIKRLKNFDENGIWVEGDNQDESTDSRTWGYLQLHELVAVAFRRH